MSLRVRQSIGKYRIERRVSEGGFATVYQAYDTIEGVRVALKIPHPKLVNDDILSDFRTEVRLAAKLEHPHILALKDASIIDDQLVIAFPLGERSLADRLRNRISLPVALELADQLIDAVAHAHGHRIIHCDIKPENCILFPGNQLR
ncbi:MAG: protein kinase domain-containing protein, partial [Planctomycetaceae bacterium]